MPWSMLSLSYEECQYNSYDVDTGATEPSFLIEYENPSEDPGAPGKIKLVVWTPQVHLRVFAAPQDPALYQSTAVYLDLA